MLIKLGSFTFKVRMRVERAAENSCCNSCCSVSSFLSRPCWQGIISYKECSSTNGGHSSSYLLEQLRAGYPWNPLSHPTYNVVQTYFYSTKYTFRNAKKSQIGSVQAIVSTMLRRIW